MTGLARAYQRRGHQVTVFAPLDGWRRPARPASTSCATGGSVSVPANGSVAPGHPLAGGCLARALRELRSTSGRRRPRARALRPRPSLRPPGEPATCPRWWPPSIAAARASSTRLFGPVTRRLADRFAVGAPSPRRPVPPPPGRSGGNYRGRSSTVSRPTVTGRSNRGRTTGPPCSSSAVTRSGRVCAVLLDAFDPLAAARACAHTGAVDRRRRAADRCVATPSWPPDADIRGSGTSREEEKVRRLVAADVLCAPSLGRRILRHGPPRGHGGPHGGGGQRPPWLPRRRRQLCRAFHSRPPRRACRGIGRRVVRPAGGRRVGRQGDDGAPTGRRRWLDDAHARAETFSMEHLAERYEAVFDRTLQGSGG